MREIPSAGRVAFAGIPVSCFTGASGGARAMPLAASPAAGTGPLTRAAYDIRGDHTRGYHRDARRFGRAGAYTCGPLGLHTRLQENACGTNGTARPLR